MSKTNEERDAGMIREGSEEGYPTVRHCPYRKLNYHLNAAGERVFHGEVSPEPESEQIPSPTPETMVVIEE